MHNYGEWAFLKIRKLLRCYCNTIISDCPNLNYWPKKLNSQSVFKTAINHLPLPPAYSKESNYLYVIPLKEFYTEKITVGVRSSLNLYHIPYTKGCHLFCTAPLDGQFLRLAVAVKTKIIMMAYKYPATLTVNGSPLTPLRSPNPMDSFIKHRVS